LNVTKFSARARAQEADLAPLIKVGPDSYPTVAQSSIVSGNAARNRMPLRSGKSEIHRQERPACVCGPTLMRGARSTGVTGP
jgi:hypothetical protein